MADTNSLLQNSGNVQKRHSDGKIIIIRRRWEENAKFHGGMQYFLREYKCPSGNVMLLLHTNNFAKEYTFSWGNAILLR